MPTARWDGDPVSIRWWLTVGDDGDLAVLEDEKCEFNVYDLFVPQLSYMAM